MIPLAIKKIAGHLVAPHHLKAMRDHLRETQDSFREFEEDPEWFEHLTDEEVVRGIDRHYEGGLQQFLEDNEPQAIYKGVK